MGDPNLYEAVQAPARRTRIEAYKRRIALLEQFIVSTPMADQGRRVWENEVMICKAAIEAEGPDL